MKTLPIKKHQSPNVSAKATKQNDPNTYFKILININVLLWQIRKECVLLAKKEWGIKLNKEDYFVHQIIQDHLKELFIVCWFSPHFNINKIPSVVHFNFAIKEDNSLIFYYIFATEKSCLEGQVLYEDNNFPDWFLTLDDVC